jgi:hypothetical protein
MIRRCAFALALLLILAGPAPAQDAVDRIGVPGPLTLEGADFALAWSAHPNARYYKQEYLPAGQSLTAYTRMVIVEVIEAGTSVKSALASQVAMLNKRKATDPLVNFAVIQNDKTGEALLDFVLGGRDAAGRTITEWNAYRYAPFGQGVMLLAVSHRAYGDEDGMTFLQQLKASRPRHIAAVTQAAMPIVKLSK